jgi:PAS domain S-box-containing protein
MQTKAKPKRVYDPVTGRFIPSEYDSNDTAIVHRALETTQPINKILAGSKQTDYSSLLNALYDATLITDINGTIIEGNLRVEHVLGYTLADLYGKNVTRLIVGGGVELIRRVQLQVQQRTFIQIECTCVHKQGQQFPAVIVANALGTGPQPRLCFFIRNAVVKRQIEQELKAANEMAIEAEKIQARIDTVATLLHTINNPLQIISCLAEMDANPEYKKQIDIIINVLDQLSQQDLLEETIDEDGQSRYIIDVPRELVMPDAGRILVVDDEKAIRDMFVLALQTQFPELKVEQAADGLSAVNLFSANQHGLILMDAQMPELNGEEAFFKIRTICRSRGMAEPSCIFCTGFQVSEQMADIIGDGTHHTFIKKPVRFSVLADTIENMMKRKTGTTIPGA